MNGQLDFRSKLRGVLPRCELRGSLRTRLAVVVAATVAVVVLLVAGSTFVLVSYQLEKGQDVSLLREATRIQRLIDAQADYVASGSNECRYAAEPGCTRLVSAQDQPTDDGTALSITQAAIAVARGECNMVYNTVTAAGVEVRTVVLPTRDRTAVMVGVPVTTTEQTINRLGIFLLVGGSVGVLLSAAVGWLVAAIGLRPVGDLAASIARVTTSRDPHDRVLVHRRDELGRLGLAFNTMLEQLAVATAAQRQLVADASHELRTPLTTLRTNISLLSRGDSLPPAVRTRLFDDIECELLGMQALVSDLVDLARGDNQSPSLCDVDLQRSIYDAVDTARRHWPDTTFSVSDHSNRIPTIVHADPSRLVRLWSVLLDNAGKYGAAPGEVDVIISESDRESKSTNVTGARPLTASSHIVVVRVVDHGAGIPKDDLPHVFDRFYRSPRARALPGSGLGLAIAHQIAQQAGGSITASMTKGGGATLTVVLPVPPLT